MRMSDPRPQVRILLKLHKNIEFQKFLIRGPVGGPNTHCAREGNGNFWPQQFEVLKKAPLAQAIIVTKDMPIFL